MKNIQTVCTWFCKSYGELSSSFWGNRQLRHINLSSCWQCKATPEGPPSATNLQSLLTLKRVRARQDWVTELPKFPYLRKLEIVIPEDIAWEPLMNLLSNLNHLGSLDCIAELHFRMTFPDCISAFRNHNHLYSFGLGWGRWPRKEIGDCTSMFPPHLVKLKLIRIDFEEDPMPQLEKLPNLKVLILGDSFMKADDGKHMICSRGGFGRLQQLKIQVSHLEEWKIEEGAMPMLNQLQLTWKKGQRHLVPDMQYLVNLQELTIYCWSDEYESRLQGEYQWKIKHIPSVNIYELQFNI